MSNCDNNKNRGTHGDSSFMLGRLLSSSENPSALAVGSVKKIDNPHEYQIVTLDASGTTSGVYLGTVSNHVPAKLKWREKNNCDVLTLDEIAEQLDKRLITVFVESPTSGKILQYGNYGDSWYEIGETCGYA